ncbi:hypothetical protein TRFO_01202 [Tritrichomonas foetus]|uniref:Tetratricopeptide repeat protein n=1 Tax=Tritrichomonas foetus TaxID=1144522 RepID=A0A1J4KIP4_9EUKA|nr:hypothetical protein TRFO_01202 [Tritrichomonas foetus]|eukprot:OHT11241.1 hypothetical protein TRFO_01202 [Tritrichomonas foetus]
MHPLTKAENNLKMVQGLEAKHSYTEAISLCNHVLEDLKPIALHQSDDTSAIQLMAVALGEMSEIYERKGEIQRALEYKRTQHSFLDYVKIFEARVIEGDDSSDDSSDDKSTSKSDEKKNARKTKKYAKNENTKIGLLEKLEDLQVMTISLSENPEDAMRQIMESLQRSKEKKVNQAIDQIINAKPQKKQNLNSEISTTERCIEFIFNHPFVIISVILLFITLVVFFISRTFRVKYEMSEASKQRLSKISEYLSKLNEVPNNGANNHHTEL